MILGSTRLEIRTLQGLKGLITCQIQPTTAQCSKVIGRGGQNFPTNLEQKHYNSQ